MIRLLNKEFKLSANILSYLFIAFSLMVFIPNYPMLVGAFFVCLGIFQSFQSYRESNDISFSLLLPVSKKEIVKAKYLFVVFIELLAFLAMLVFVLIRMTLLKDANVYLNGKLMNPNLVFLGYSLVVFGLFNLLFVRGFFKTAYYFGKPFLLFCIVGFLFIVLTEVIFHIPGLDKLNSRGFENIVIQLIGLACGIILYVFLTLIAYKQSVRTFERIDL